jgi:hypothetical protein
VPIIEKTDVIEDDREDEVVRVAHFIEAHGQSAHSVREVCRSYYPTKVRHYTSDTVYFHSSQVVLEYRSISSSQTVPSSRTPSATVQE